MCHSRRDRIKVEQRIFLPIRFLPLTTIFFLLLETLTGMAHSWAAGGGAFVTQHLIAIQANVASTPSIAKDQLVKDFISLL